MSGRVFATISIAILLAVAALPVSGRAELIREGFENNRLDQDFWSLRNMPDKRFWFDKRIVRSGKRSLAIMVKGFDIDLDCKCQKSEIREKNPNRIKFGDDVWYAFSFYLHGRAGNSIDTRWQIAGWKQESDGSPFLAQRMDNDVFHITLESGNSRVLLAAARGKPQSFMEAISKGLMSRFGYLTEKEKYDGTHNVKLVFGHNPILPNPHKGWVDMMYHVKGGLDGTGIVEVFANNRFIVRATGIIGVKDFTGPTQYFRIGHNRAALPGTAIIYIDNFRRGKTRKDVENWKPAAK